jgi:hypothetical protein
MFLVEAAKQCRHQGHIQIWDDSKPERPFEFAGSAAELLQRRFDLTQNRPRVLLKTQTRRGERDTLALTLKKNRPQTGLQIPHLLRNGRLRNPESLGRSAEVSGNGRFEKVAQLRISKGSGMARELLGSINSPSTR